MPRVRLRGIYATALSERLRETVEIVDASTTIEARFDAAFDRGPPDVVLGDAPDQRGVGLSGQPDGVRSVGESLRSLSRDTILWRDPAPRGATFDTTVTETLGSGAIVDLGPREGFLKYDNADRRIEAGDALTVQVRDPVPPWDTHRPAVATGLEVRAGPVTLVSGENGPRADVPDSQRANELMRSVDLLGTESPDGWFVRFERGAAEASLAELDDAVALAVDRVVDGLESSHSDNPPMETAWVWFGRDARFALDDLRRRVVTTIPGHHRIKAVSNEAGIAVDLVEALWADLDASALDGATFPFGTVTDLLGPRVGDRLALSHGKPDGRRFELGVGEVTACEDRTVTLRREMTGGGRYDGLGVEREAGDVAVTRLTEGKWWYPTVYRDADGTVKGTYLNVCTPLELFPDGATYVDLEVDVVKYADGTVERLDEQELAAAVEAGHVSDELAEKARAVAASIEEGLSH